MKKRIVVSMMALMAIAASANAQIRTYTTSAEDSIACVQNLSLYIEYFKQDNFADALPGWRQAAKICPKATESLWINGIKLYSELIEKEGDAVKKSALIDTLEWVYDQRIEHFGKEGYVLGRKGSDMVKYRSSNPKAANEVLMKSLQLQGNEMEPGACIYLYKSAYDMYRDKLSDKSTLFDLYSQLGEIIDHNLANQSSPQMKAAYQSAQDNIDKMFGSVAECPDLVEIYTPKLNAAPKDERLLRQILKVFDKRNCTDEDLYLKAAAALYEIEPSATAAYAIANGYVKKDRLSEAVEYYNKATQTDDVDLKTKAITNAARTSLKLGRYGNAKSLANQLLAMNPNNGDAYIIIGDAYVNGRKECGDNECTNRAAYWAAVDKYQRAKAVDPSVAETAQSRINTYSGQFPKKEDCFFHGLTEGGTFTLDCWIGETTTVRVRE